MHRPRYAALPDFLRRAVTERRAPGVAAAVVDRNRLLFLDAAGIRDAAANAPLTPDAIFRIASMTKPITSLAAMLLVEDGALDLDAPATRYLAELARVRVLTSYDERDGTWTARPPSRPITLRHLLTHTAGMSYSFLDPRLTKIDTGSMARVDVPLLHDPGDRFTYSFATTVVGSIVAAVSHTSLDEFCRARIFAPLGMNDTGYDVPAEHARRVVTMQVREGSGFVERPNPPVIASRGRGDDGLFSTAEDYGKFIQLFLNRGTSGGRRVATEETIRAMMSDQLGARAIGIHPAVAGAIATPFPIGGEKDAFGFGFQIETAPPRPGGGRSVGSCSWSGIWNTYFWIDPANEIGVVVLMQFMPAHDAGAITILNGVERIVYGQPAPSPSPYNAPRVGARGLGLSCTLHSSRFHHQIRIVQRQRDDPIAVAFESDDRRRTAGRMKGKLALVEDSAVDCARAGDHQLVLLRADDERVARPIAERVAADERRALAV